MIVKRLLLAIDTPGLTCWLAGRFGVEIPAETVARWMAKARKMDIRPSRRQPYGSSLYNDDDTWAMWFANRLAEDGYGHLFRGRCEPPSVEGFEVQLHVGFIFIEETDSMLARLRRKDDSEPKREGPDTPGIERTEVKVRPIDRVAARVVGLRVEEATA